jgi:hypothetical protein
MHAIAIEGADTTGRSYSDWIDLDRLELDA